MVGVIGTLWNFIMGLMERNTYDHQPINQFVSSSAMKRQHEWRHAPPAKRVKIRQLIMHDATTRLYICRRFDPLHKTG